MSQNLTKNEAFCVFFFSLFGVEKYKQNLSKMKEDTVPRGPERKGTEYSVVRCNGNLHLPLNAGYHFEEVGGLKKIESLRS